MVIWQQEVLNSVSWRPHDLALVLFILPIHPSVKSRSTKKTINMSNYQDNYDENAARWAGETVGRAGKPIIFFNFQETADSINTEGSYDRADQAIDREEQNVSNDFRRGEQALENAPENMARDVQQGFNNTVQGVENIPSDIGNGIMSAANWIGDKIGGVENEGRRAEQGAENEWNEDRQKVDQFDDRVEDRYNRAEQDVDRFNQGVENSYDQGEQQGRREGW